MGDGMNMMSDIRRGRRDRTVEEEEEEEEEEDR